MRRWLCVGALGLLGCTYEAADGEQEAIGVSSQEVVGGTDADIADYPWQVYVQTRVWGFAEERFFACGGSIIADNWVLTAQHCLTNLDNGDFPQLWASPRDVLIVAGTDDLTSLGSAQIRRAAEFIPLSTYNGNAGLGSDAVLVRLHEAFDLSGPDVEAILPLHENAAANGVSDPGTLATVTGWGHINNSGGTTTRLQELEVPIVSNAVASAAYGFPVSDDQIGAGNLLGINGSCVGDSGGPLVVWQKGVPKLAGIVSYGSSNGCAFTGYPDMYTRVSAIRPWIAESRRTRRHELLFSSFAQGVATLRTVTVELPAGATELTVELRNGQGDGDIFIRHGSAVGLATRYDDAACFSDNYGSNEFCPVHDPAPGTWHLSSWAWTDLTNVKLVVNYRVPR